MLSAGLYAIPGMRTDCRAVALGEHDELDMTGHCAVPLSPRMLEASYLVLTMNAWQRRMVEQRYPSVRGRVFRPLETTDVGDPYRNTVDAYAEILQNLSGGLEHGSSRLTRLVNESTYLHGSTPGLHS
ncbi:arsenate reductase/protein-tyrosine-phosphatase family protein [Paraburkholderia sediminicola]|uniref:arsenate reductase/protein-tyrosine-phosphatase family protein n=1 Tax=Paraburkholderia sediminicola TaxID=458836 RepID=UPI0038BCBFBB